MASGTIRGNQSTVNSPLHKLILNMDGVSMRISLHTYSTLKTKGPNHSFCITRYCASCHSCTCTVACSPCWLDLQTYPTSFASHPLGDAWIIHPPASLIYHPSVLSILIRSLARWPNICKCFSFPVLAASCTETTRGNCMCCAIPRWVSPVETFRPPEESYTIHFHNKNTVTS